MKKIYLAIPYSGMAESSYEQATKASAELMKEYGGINVFSPITHSHALTEYGLRGDWAFWKEIDFQFIDWADEVWVLIPNEGVEKVLKSVGVIGEINHANETGKPVHFYKRDDDGFIREVKSL